MSAELREIAEKTELLLAELRQVNQNGPQLRVLHRFRTHGIIACEAGEEISAVLLLPRDKEVLVPLSRAMRIVVDYLGHQRFPQSASQIAAGIQRSHFYKHEGARARIYSRLKISRSAINEYIKRIRLALKCAFREAGLELQPSQVIESIPSVGNEVLYRLRAQVEVCHIDEIE